MLPPAIKNASTYTLCSFFSSMLYSSTNDLVSGKKNTFFFQLQNLNKLTRISIKFILFIRANKIESSSNLIIV